MFTDQVILFITLNLLSILLVIKGEKGFGPTDQEWGYVTVRDGAHMFWWLHYKISNETDPTQTPIVIWLQGGPGASSTGFGNFGEIGPIDEHLKIRKHAWTNKYNVLFVDNPVGAGFSYVDDNSKLVTNNTQIAEDFLVFLQKFYEKYSKFSSTPLYIFCESYGGKMVPEIALLLHQAQKDGRIKSNLKGIGLGDPWISPIDSLTTWGPYLLNQGLTDGKGYKAIQKVAQEANVAMRDGRYLRATELFKVMQYVIANVANNVDFYNVLTKVKVEGNNMKKAGKLIKPSVETIDEDAIYKIMNNQVKKALKLDRNWTNDNDDVFSALSEDFMKPVTDIIEKLLNETTLKIVVYSGQLDLIVDTPGTIKWVDKLKWNGTNKWKMSDHRLVVVNNIIEGFYKNIGNFTFYWVSRAGHMVPYDNPNAMDFILDGTIKG